jgi:hypothetical protein
VRTLRRFLLSRAALYAGGFLILGSTSSWNWLHTPALVLAGVFIGAGVVACSKS